MVVKSSNTVAAESMKVGGAERSYIAGTRTLHSEHAKHALFLGGLGACPPPGKF